MQTGHKNCRPPPFPLRQTLPVPRGDAQAGGPAVLERLMCSRASLCSETCALRQKRGQSRSFGQNPPPAEVLKTADCQRKNSVERPRSPKPRPTSRSPRHFCVPRRDGRIPKAACSRSGSRGADRQTVRRYTWRQVAQKMSSILFLQSLNKKRALGLELLRLSLLDTDNLRLLRCQRRLRKAGRQHAGSNTPTAPLHKPFPKGRGGVFPTS